MIWSHTIMKSLRGKMQMMKKTERNRKTKLDILNQTRDRTPMPRPTVFRDKKKYDRNAVKEEGRQEQEEQYDD